MARQRRAILIRDRDGLLDELAARVERERVARPDRRVTREGLVVDVLQDWMRFFRSDPPDK